MGAREVILGLYPDLVSAPNLDGAIATATSQVDQSLPNAGTGTAYLALHLMGITKVPLGANGGVVSAKAGGVSRAFGSGGGGGAHGSTMWGREFDNWVESTVCGLPAQVPGWILY